MDDGADNLIAWNRLLNAAARIDAFKRAIFEIPKRDAVLEGDDRCGPLKRRRQLRKDLRHLMRLHSEQDDVNVAEFAEIGNRRRMQREIAGRAFYL